MPVAHGAGLCLGKGSGTAVLVSKARISLHIHSFQAVLSSAAASLLLSDSKLGCFQAVPSVSPPPQLWLWQGQGVATAANTTSLPLASQAFPFGHDAPQTCASSTGRGAAAHRSSPSPSFLPLLRR